MPSMDQIKKHWEENIEKHGSKPDSSWSDVNAIELEIRTLSSYLKPGERILDAGCNNGYASLQYAQTHAVDLYGFDYIPAMIQIANESLNKTALAPGSRVTFAHGDILNFSGGINIPFDKIIITRVIINLGTWENQMKALKECLRVLKPGGCLLLSEASLQGWQNMNQFRAEWDLPQIPMPEFNLYVDESKLLPYMAAQTDLLECQPFASTYYVGTRILKPLLAKALGLDASHATKADMHWNRWMSLLPAWGDYGVQKLFVFRKK